MGLFAGLLMVAFGAAGCSGSNGGSAETVGSGPDRQSAFRVRSGFDAELNASGGWAAGINESVTVRADRPFRLRFEVESAEGGAGEGGFRLQYRRERSGWTNVKVSDFPYPERLTPSAGIVSTSAYAHGAATRDVLQGSSLPFRAGAGVALADRAPDWSGGAAHGEWEWPLVIRRYADGPRANETGDTFEFRMIRGNGGPLDGYARARVELTVPPRHLGGTFVETPGRLGPWQTSTGDLYFVMEPTETDNRLMVVKSTDEGESWREIDGSNRPATGDLEGFATAFTGGAIHMLHQTSDRVLHHSFRTADHPNQPDTWNARDVEVAAPPEPPTQVATIAARSDGSLVGVYGGPEKIRYAIRSSRGTWGEEAVIDADVPPNLSGPQTVLGANDAVHLAYTGSDGTAWYRRIRANGTLTPRRQLATGLGTTEYDVGSVLPLVYLPATSTAVVIYRLGTGRLWERRIPDGGIPSDPVRVTEHAVAQNAVDSDQTGADAIGVGASVHVLFIGEDSGHIFHTRSEKPGSWTTPTPAVEEIRGQWVRGNLLERREDDAPVYGFVYDAGSNGGSGMNRYGEISLDTP